MTAQLIMTRPKGQADRFVAALRAEMAAPFDVILSPLIRIVPCAVDAPATPPAHVIFSSANAVDHAAQLNLPKGIPAWCVGDRTAAAATAAGFAAQSAGGAGRDLLALIKSKAPKGPMLYLHGRDTRIDFAAALGPQCQALCVYDQVPEKLTTDAQAALTGADPVVIPLFSPRTAAIFADQATITAPACLIAISQAAADPLRHLPGNVPLRIAKQPDLKGMVDETKGAFQTL